MKKQLLLVLAALALVLAGPALATTAGAQSHHGHDPDHDHEMGTFDTVLHHYEMVRARLADDSLEGVGDHARALTENLRPLQQEFDARAAGVEPDATAQAKTLLREIHAAAETLATADGLDATRDAFYELSKPLVRYRELMKGDDKPHVVYCSMAKKSWLQPTEEIGNPYHGSSMKRCGAVVSQ